MQSAPEVDLHTSREAHICDFPRKIDDTAELKMHKYANEAFNKLKIPPPFCV